MFELTENATVFRALRRSWVDKETRQVLSTAFRLRALPKDPSGLSIDVQSPQTCFTALSDCSGVGAVPGKPILALGLKVEVSHFPHANMVGLPRPMSSKPEDIEFTAGELAKAAKWIPPEECV
jgi:hypothetical protein